jgi:hypothetical protein
MERSGAKVAHRAGLDDIAKLVANVVNREPGHNWMITKHKPESIDGDLEKLARAKLKGIDKRAQFATLGRDDRSSNEFGQCDRVFFAGTLIAPRAALLAHAYAAGGSDYVESWATDKEEQAKFRAGYIDDGILQAIGRSNVRNGVEGACGECLVYVLASRQSGVKDRLTAIFPGCTVEDWHGSGGAKYAVPKKRDNQMTRAVAFIDQWLAKEPTAMVPVEEVRKAAECLDRKDFNKRVVGPAALSGAFETRRIAVVRGPRKKLLGFRRAAVLQN